MLNAQILPTFHKLNVHAAMTPTDIQKHLKPVFAQAKKLQESFKSKTEGAPSLRVPFVTVSTQYSHVISYLVFTVFCRTFSLDAN